MEDHDEIYNGHTSTPPPLAETQYTNYLSALNEEITFTPQELKYKKYSKHAMSYSEVAGGSILNTNAAQTLKSTSVKVQKQSLSQLPITSKNPDLINSLQNQVNMLKTERDLLTQKFYNLVEQLNAFTQCMSNIFTNFQP